MKLLYNIAENTVYKVLYLLFHKGRVIKHMRNILVLLKAMW